MTYLLLIVSLILVAGLVVAVRRQAKVTRSFSAAEQEQNAQFFAESANQMETTVADALAAKARDRRLASMSQEDLVYEVLKECYDPEIPLNVVDLGLIYEVRTLPDAVTVKMSMTSPMCPSHASISEDIRTKLSEAGFPNPGVEVVWEPAWSPQRISEAGRRTLGI